MDRHVLALLMMCLAPLAGRAAVHEVKITNFGFTPQNLTIEVGDTVRWQNTEGTHNVVATDPPALFYSGPPSSEQWTYEFTFTEPGSYGYTCEEHGHRLEGYVLVKEGESAFVVDVGVAGAWYEPATSGQGFFFDVDASLDLLAGAWFTWTQNVGEHDWYTFLASSIQADTVVADVFRNNGGRFDDPAVEVEPSLVVGTLEIRFHACDRATASYSIQETEPPLTGTIELIRILPATQQCQASNPPP